MIDPVLHESVLAYLEDRLDGYLAILKSWVEINSFTSNAGGVNALGAETGSIFAGLGFAAERVPSVTHGFGDHLVLTRAGAGGPVIGLVSHLDTVFPPDEETANEFAWRVDGERVFGPGTVDIKGGTLVIYMMLDALRKFRPEVFNRVAWTILLDASEETLSNDFGTLCTERLTGAAACLVFEGGFYENGTFRLVHRRKGMAKFRIRSSGRAAHAGVAHGDGANAIVGVADVVRSVADLTDYGREITFNIGVISGGTVSNRVPHNAEALGEMRAFDADVFQEGLLKLSGLGGDGLTVPGGNSCEIAVEVLDTTPPWPENPETERLLEIWTRSAEALGFRIVPEARGGLSDGNHTWSWIPTLDGLGPSGGNAHCSEQVPERGKEQEYLYVPSLIPKTVLNLVAILELAESTQSVPTL
ncbi:MAG TPA: M20/M25/M40 family metallo-hydrolase [Anaerolineales bacterium]|nr:M20/M25/M40 family metallo-hydrolase [Anaerolineales bacterium]